jgi:hypothetical protein
LERSTLNVFNSTTQKFGAYFRLQIQITAEFKFGEFYGY